MGWFGVGKKSSLDKYISAPQTPSPSWTALDWTGPLVGLFFLVYKGLVRLISIYRIWNLSYSRVASIDYIFIAWKLTVSPTYLSPPRPQPFCSDFESLLASSSFTPSCVSTCQTARSSSIYNSGISKTSATCLPCACVKTIVSGASGGFDDVGSCVAVLATGRLFLFAYNVSNIGDG